MTVASAFKSKDADGDGALSLQELCAGLSALHWPWDWQGCVGFLQGCAEPNSFSYEDADVRSLSKNQGPLDIEPKQ